MPLYQEKLSSRRTTGLFLSLTAIFLAFLAWRWNVRGLDGWGVAFLCFAVIFAFYTLNYRTLHISISVQALQLRFGLFTWTIPLEKIAAIQPDNPPPFKRYGGAGIHWFLVDGLYRASWNFLEYPRILVNFYQPAGPVKGLSFSTQKPEEVIRIVQAQLNK